MCRRFGRPGDRQRAALGVGVVGVLCPFIGSGFDPRILCERLEDASTNMLKRTLRSLENLASPKPDGLAVFRVDRASSESFVKHGNRVFGEVDGKSRARPETNPRPGRGSPPTIRTYDAAVLRTENDASNAPGTP